MQAKLQSSARLRFISPATILYHSVHNTDWLQKDDIDLNFYVLYIGRPTAQK